ncbi:hypothetical protein NE237_027506 [Protea cynaroides]|uniref:Uncharacterized protein n=1 Tax=Protea cynaroides TaxID=273540 RepID=A0A9Q0JRZ7_9MAGN|nr:hypothetical protein NE237_027506 [Protea cynaroides]
MRKQEMQISDFIDRDEDCNKIGMKRRRKGGFGGSLSHSPRWILSRWLSHLKRRSREPSNSRNRVVLVETEERRTNEWERRREEERKSVHGYFLSGCQTDGAKGESSSSLVQDCQSSEILHSSAESSGRYMKELSFNLGLGVGLVYLIAESKTEIKKMMELRTQMEMLLKEIKDGMQRKDTEITKDCIHLPKSRAPRERNGDLLVEGHCKDHFSACSRNMLVKVQVLSALSCESNGVGFKELDLDSITDVMYCIPGISSSWPQLQQFLAVVHYENDSNGFQLSLLIIESIETLRPPPLHRTVQHIVFFPMYADPTLLSHGQW